MEIQVTNISYELDNEEGMNSLFFEYDKGYFTIARMDDDENIYVELDSQDNGKYLDPDCFEFSFFNKKISFKIDGHRKVDVGIYDTITLLFEPVNKDVFSNLSKTLKNIFKERF